MSIVDASREFLILSKSNCPYCDKAKIQLYKMTMDIDGDSTTDDDRLTIINCDKYLNNSATKEAFLADVEATIGHPYKTFPMIFHYGHFIGGYNELVEYDKRLRETTEAFFTGDF